jgi:hypothetical protein
MVWKVRVGLPPLFLQGEESSSTISYRIYCAFLPVYIQCTASVLCEMDPSSLSACVRRALFVSQEMYVTMAVMIAASDSYHDAHAIIVPREERVLCFVWNGG